MTTEIQRLNEKARNVEKLRSRIDEGILVLHARSEEPIVEERLKQYRDHLDECAEHIEEALMISKPENLVDVGLLLSLAWVVAADVNLGNRFSEHHKNWLLPRMIREAVAWIEREAGPLNPGGDRQNAITWDAERDEILAALQKLETGAQDKLTPDGAGLRPQ